MSNKTKSPSHRVYVVTKEGRKTYWGRPIGAVWPHADGKGFSLKLNYLPLMQGAELVIREPLPETDDKAVPAEETAIADNAA
jgi:hypothetical protein